MYNVFFLRKYTIKKCNYQWIYVLNYTIDISFSFSFSFFSYTMLLRFVSSKKKKLFMTITYLRMNAMSIG